MHSLDAGADRLRDVAWFGFRETDSTNDDAKRFLARSRLTPEWNPQSFAVFCSLSQTSGRGKGGRAWHSPSTPGSAAVTFLIPKPVLFDPAGKAGDSPQDDGFAVIVAALAVARASALFLCNPLKKRLLVKWPNDVLFGSVKVAGVLTEKIPQCSAANPWPFDFFVIGCGWNLSAAPEIAGAGCLAEAALGGTPYGMMAARLLAREFVSLISELSLKGRDALIECWMKAALGLSGGVLSNGAQWSVSALGRDGSLFLRSRDTILRVTDPDLADWSLAKRQAALFQSKGLA